MNKTNHLINEKSPYLLQHQHNPVDWYPWGEEAFDKARRENKPIFLCIGYSTCHWCHVMERESFEDQKIADFLNAHFVSIKVDREERPDVDKIYMTAVQALTGNGGWPLNCFLTPELKPFYGGTYFPPTNRQGTASFIEVLRRIAQLWTQQPDKIMETASEFHRQLAAVATKEPGSLQVSAEFLDNGPQPSSNTNTTHSLAGSVARQSFRGRANRCFYWDIRCAKETEDAEAKKRCTRATGWRPGASTISLGVGLRVIRWMRNGWCHISRRCFTITRNF